jgi:hypothetical protein
VLEVGREHEFEDVVNANLGLYKFEFRRAFGDWEQEHVSFFVCSLWVIRPPEPILYYI